MNIIFGTDGWRAILDKEINSETVAIVAQAFADYLNHNFENPTAAIGFDGSTLKSLPIFLHKFYLEIILMLHYQLQLLQLQLYLTL
jgi:phosphoglucomutase